MGQDLQVSDFDQMGVVVDWLDACRRHDLSTLVALYASDAHLECACDGVRVCHGRAELEAYWRTRLDAFAPEAFQLEGIQPVGDGVELHCINAGGAAMRVVFGFDPDGKIRRTRCEPIKARGASCGAC
jgi:hypothetical protein